MKYFSYFFTVFLFVICLSCQEDIPERYCKNERALFAVSDSIPKIKINYNVEQDIIRNQIDSVLGLDICLEEYHFGLMFENDENLDVCVWKGCLDTSHIIVCGTLGEHRLSINSKGEIYFRNIIPIDSIKSVMVSSFPDNQFRKLNGLKLNWKQDAPTDSINKILKNIAEGKLLIYEKLAQQQFNQSVCELNVSQLDSLKSSYNLRISFNFMPVFIDPPPVVLEIPPIITP